jgi:long-subunit fatty acid transport protein
MLKNIVLKTIAVFLINFVSIFSQNTNDVLRLAFPGLGVGGRALGMGNSYVGVSDDASASYFNPAGLGLIKRMEFSGGIDYYKMNNSATLFGNTTEYSNSSTQINQLAFVFPFPTLQGSLVFGLAYNQNSNLTSALNFDGFNPANNSRIQYLTNQNSDLIYDLLLSFPVYDQSNNYLYDSTVIQGKLNQNGLRLNSGSVQSWALSTAIEIYKNLFVGGTLNIISGEFTSSYDYYEEDILRLYQNVLTDPTVPTTKGFQSLYMNSLMNWDISGWDLKIGLLYQLNKISRIGATLQFPKSYTIKEKYSVDAYSQFSTNTVYLANPEDYETIVEYDILTPFVISTGASFNYMGFLASGEISFSDYSQSEFSNPRNISQREIVEMNKEIKSLLGAAVNYNLGLEYTFPLIGLRLRGGYFTQQSAYKNDPSDFNRKFLTGGAGFLIDETLSVDLTYLHGWWKDYGDNYGFNLSRTFQEISIDRLMLSFSYRF